MKKWQWIEIMICLVLYLKQFGIWVLAEQHLVLISLGVFLLFFFSLFFGLTYIFRMSGIIWQSNTYWIFTTVNTDKAKVHDNNKFNEITEIQYQSIICFICMNTNTHTHKKNNTQLRSLQHLQFAYYYKK